MNENRETNFKRETEHKREIDRENTQQIQSLVH